MSCIHSVELGSSRRVVRTIRVFGGGGYKCPSGRDPLDEHLVEVHHTADSPETDDAQHALVRFVTPHVHLGQDVEASEGFGPAVEVGIETDPGPLLHKGQIFHALHARVVAHGIAFATPVILLHSEQTTIRTQLDHLLFVCRAAAWRWVVGSPPLLLPER